MHARLDAVWSAYPSSVASQLVPDQPSKEGGENEDFSDFARDASNLSLERWVEARVVGWGDALIVAA